jgi:proline iminopeptidase
VFPVTEPYARGMVPAAHGAELYWECSGTPAGAPALVLHGGPGAPMSEGYRRQFDPDRWRIVYLDQRGCGRSRPLAHRDLASLTTNTTGQQIDDLELLRTHLGIDRWLVVGGSWGVTLALAYAQRHPDRVTGLALAAITDGAREQLEWITQDMRRVFPREWDDFAAASGRRPGQRVLDAYRERITDPDPAVRFAAAKAWCAWEDVHVSLAPGWEPWDRYADPDFRAQFATLVIHYWANDCFLPRDGVRSGMAAIGHIPGVLIHGRYDVSGPLSVAWDLHRAWPASRLVVLDDSGHGGPSMSEALTAAIADLGGRPDR